MSENSAQEAVTMAMTSALFVGCSYTAANCCAKGLALGVLVCILFTVVELLLERPGFLLVGKRQTSQTILEFKGMEEYTVLVVREGVVDLLIPYYTSGLRLPVSVCDFSWRDLLERTDMSTILSQKVFPTRSLASTTAPCSPVYVHRCLSG